MTRARSFAGAFALALAAPAVTSVRAECPTGYEFVVVADDAGELALSDAPYGGQPTRPAIDTDGKVAFTAWLDAGGRAILLGDEHSLSERLRDRDADPESEFSSLSEPLPSIEGKVVFGAERELAAGQPLVPVLAEITGAGRVNVLATGDAGRDGSNSPYRALDRTAFDVAENGEVVFSARLTSERSAVVWADEGVTRTAVTGDPGVLLGSPAAGSPDEFCYFEHGGAGPLLRAANGLAIAETDPATGLGALPPVAMGEGGTVAYVFSYADPDRPGYAARQIRRYSPVTQTSRVIADSALGDFGAAGDLPHPSIVAGQIDVSGRSRGIAGCVVWDAQGDEGRDTLYIADEDGVATVLAEGDELFGALVASLEAGAHAVNGHGRIALWVQLTDNRKLIVRADPTSSGTGSSDAGTNARDDSDRGSERGEGDAPESDGRDDDDAHEGYDREDDAAEDAGGSGGGDAGGSCTVRNAHGAGAPTWLLTVLGAVILRRRRSQAARLRQRYL